MNGAVLAPLQSLISQGSQFPLRKPAGFHYDFALLGLTTFLAGLLGIPAPNGLIPQAPIHTCSLIVHKLVRKDEGPLRNGDGEGELCEVPVAVTVLGVQHHCCICSLYPLSNRCDFIACTCVRNL
jgi:HCO3- transporter family